MLKYIDEVIVPFVQKKRETLELDENHPALAVFDHFKGQLTKKVTDALEKKPHPFCTNPSCIHWASTIDGHLCQ